MFEACRVDSVLPQKGSVCPLVVGLSRSHVGVLPPLAGGFRAWMLETPKKRCGGAFGGSLGSISPYDEDGIMIAIESLVRETDVAARARR